MKKNLSYIIMLVAGAVIMAACSKDELPNDIPDAAGSEVLFTGAIKKQSEVLATTRSNNDMPNPDDYIVLNKTNTEFGTFYIWMNVEGNNYYFQQYGIVSGKQGSLEVIGNGNKLNWQDKTSKHTFYAWTQPHVQKDETPTITGGVNMQIPEFGKQTSNYNFSGTVTFGTNRETKLEQFIITKKGPVSYNTWGQDVALYFERPISKIVLDMVIHIDATGAIDKDINNCSIVFPNMYKEATFKPFDFGDDSNFPLNGDDANGKGIEWNWEKDNKESNSLYVLPFKFGDDDDNKIQNDLGYFIVTLKGKNYAGSLNSLTIGENAKELKAGECLKLVLTINDGGGVGAGYMITDWHTESNEGIYEHRIPGVYNEDDADRLLKALNKEEGYTFPDDVQDLIVKTSEDNVTPETYEINLFTHIDWSLVTSKINIPENYTLNGNGFNVKLGSGGSISKVKNIYINGQKPDSTTGGDGGEEESTPEE